MNKRLFVLALVCTLSLFAIITYANGATLEISNASEDINASLHLQKPRSSTGKDISGDNQIGIVGNNLPNPLVVLITDEKGNPLPGIKLQWDIISEPPGIKKHIKIIPLNESKSDAQGLFKAECILGDKPGNYRILFYVLKEKPPKANFIEYEVIAKKQSWINWMLVGLLGGLALFLYGMKVGSDGLQSIAKAKLRSTIGSVAQNPFAGLGLGTLVTFVTQSSSATTTMLVSLANTRLLGLRESFALIFGAAIGTTITVQLISFNIYDYSLFMIIAGFLFIFIGKSRRSIAIGNIILGFGFIFFGMKVMIETMGPLRLLPAFSNAILVLKNHPVWSIFFATIFTAIVQSSGAILGLALSAASQGLIDLKTAIPIIFGANIGTCFTAMMASSTGARVGKRLAWAHLLFKVIGVIVFFPLIQQLAHLGSQVSFFIQPDASLARQVANTHTIFAIIIALLFLPLRSLLQRLVYLILPEQQDEGDEVKLKYLDLQILDAPTIAVGSALREISRMGRFVEEMMRAAADFLFYKNEAQRDFIHIRDDKVDKLQASIVRYLVNLTQRGLSNKELEKVFGLLFIVSDLENIGDIIDKNIAPLADKMIIHDLEFSEEGKKELLEIHKKVSEDLSQVMVALVSFDTELAKGVMAHKSLLSDYGRELHLHHLRRLQEGLRETVDTSAVHIDCINYFQRIEFYTFRIASVISGKSQCLFPDEIKD
jgi:phosphate:Na+ symporter